MQPRADVCDLVPPSDRLVGKPSANIVIKIFGMLLKSSPNCRIQAAPKFINLINLIYIGFRELLKNTFFDFLLVSWIMINSLQGFPRDTLAGLECGVEEISAFNNRTNRRMIS
jgi:hypothetical protein